MPTGKIKKDVVTANGALQKGSVVEILSESKNMITVKDNVGRIYYIEPSKISVEKKRAQ